MTNLLPAGFFNDPLRINSEAKDGMDALIEFGRERMGGSAETVLTIASGTIVPTTGIHAINTEFSDLTDDLSNISTSRHPDGSMLLMRCADNGRVVTVKHAAGGAGSIVLTHNVDFVMNNTKKWLLLKRTGANWEECFRSYGQDMVAIRAQLGLGTASQHNVGTTEGTIPVLTTGGALPAVGGQNLTGLSFIPLGCPVPYFGVALPAGWIWSRGYTIGRAGSGGSERANDDCWPLFNHLWWHLADGQAPVSGGRSGDPSYDFWNRYCTIRVPDCRGKALVGMDNMGYGAGAGLLGNIIAGSVLGATGGAEVHQLLYYQSGMPQHGHSVTDLNHQHPLYDGPAGGHAHPDGDAGHGHPGGGTASLIQWLGEAGPPRLAGVQDNFTMGYSPTPVGIGVGTGYAQTGVGVASLVAHGNIANWSTTGARVSVNDAGNANATNWHNNLPPSIICGFILRL